MPPKHQRISTLLSQFAETHSTGKVSYRQIVDGFQERAFSFVLILFCAPMALPLPVPPGVSFVLALPVFFVAVQLLIGKHTIWLPEWLARKTVSAAWLNKVVSKLVPYLHKAERILKPRLIRLTTRRAERMLGVLFFLLALSISMPFPLSNTLPSLAIVIIAVGLLEHDGLVMLGGVCVGFAALILTSAVIYFGVEAVRYAIGMVTGA